MICCPSLGIEKHISYSTDSTKKQIMQLLIAIIDYFYVMFVLEKQLLFGFEFSNFGFFVFTKQLFFHLLQTPFNLFHLKEFNLLVFLMIMMDHSLVSQLILHFLKPVYHFLLFLGI